MKNNYPIGVRWNITEQCYRKCLYCEVKNYQINEELSTGEVKAIVDQISKRAVCLIFSGGEPLARNDMGEVIAYCKKKGIKRIELNSSGYGVKEKIKELLPLTKLKLSIDGPESIHDKMRGDGSFNIVKEASYAAKNSGIKVVFNSMLTNQNLNQLDFLVKFASELHSQITFEPLRNLSLRKDVYELRPTREKFVEAVDKLIVLKGRNSSFIQNSVKELEFIRDWPHGKQFSCAAGKLFCVIRPNGILESCDHIIPLSNSFASEKQELNILKLGFNKAVSMLGRPFCKGCGCEGAIKLSRMMNSPFSSISDIWQEFYILTKS